MYDRSCWGGTEEDEMVEDFVTGANASVGNITKVTRLVHIAWQAFRVGHLKINHSIPLLPSLSPCLVQRFSASASPGRCLDSGILRSMFRFLSDHIRLHIGLRFSVQ